MPKVILADDEEFVRYFLMQVMDSIHFDVVAEVEKGDELIYAMRKYQPDILLLDINMPKFTGLEFLKEYSSEFPNTCIIILTSVTSAQLMDEVSAKGVSCFLRKDTPPDKMIVKIKECWETLEENKMYNSDFKKYLSDNTGVDFTIIKELFDKNPNVFDTATTLINLYGVDRGKLGKIWGDYLGFAYVDPNETIVKIEYVNKLGMDFIKKNKVMPLYKFGRAVTVSTSDPTNPFMQDKLEKMLDEIVSLVFCFPFDVEKYLNKGI